MKTPNIGVTHRAFPRLATRFFRILKRYGLSSKKMESKLKRYLDIVQQQGIIPTFPITAKAVERHPGLIQKLSDNGVEFAVHGYEHVHYPTLAPDAAFKHIRNASEIFIEHNVTYSGFRFPYLSWDKKCFDIIDNQSFKWDSSHTILWDVIPTGERKRRDSLDFENMLDLYNCKSSSRYLSLPKFYNNILEIPVSLPDDDLLERLGITENDAAGAIWGQILRESHTRGELFTLQLHPERIFLFEDVLRSLIQTAQGLYPRVWFASLNSISDWWKEKKAFTIELNSKGNSQYEVVANCSPRATLLVTSPDFENDQFIDGFSYVKERAFSIKSPTRPIVGIPRYSSPNLMEFLRNEGFVFEESEHKENYSVYLAGFADFSQENEIKALETIHSTDLPLVRFWRWPNGCRSTLAVTGDIDGLTSVDFLFRVFALPA